MGFAMFRVSESGYVTIDPCSPLTQDEFQAVGRFVGLAFYNGAHLGIHFPTYFLDLVLAVTRGVNDLDNLGSYAQAHLGMDAPPSGRRGLDPRPLSEPQGVRQQVRPRH